MGSAFIHPTAVVSEKAEIDSSVVIGPLAIVEDNVHIGAGSTIGPLSIIRNFSRIGKNNTIDAHVVIGGDPQHTAFDGSESWVRIGDNNIIREATVIHRAFVPGAATIVGSDCFLMSQLHIGHDCVIGDKITLSSYVVLGGHVEIGDCAVLGGGTGVHQFLRIGAYSMVAGQTPLRKDVLPYSMIGGNPVRHYRLNSVGLRRAGIKKERYRALEASFRALREGDKEMSGVPDTEEVNQLREWLSVKSNRGVYGFLCKD